MSISSQFPPAIIVVNHQLAHAAINGDIFTVYESRFVTA